MSSSSSLTDALRSISRTAQSIGSFVAPLSRPVPITPPTQQPTDIPPISLPEPASIHTQLLAIGCSPALADDLSRMHLLKTDELRSATQRHLHTMCAKLAESPRHHGFPPLPQLLAKVIAAFTAKYSSDLKILEQRAVMTVSRKLQARNAQQTRVEKKPFNRDFIPFLEQYFEHDPFPTAADRKFMASKSNMSARQIEVWFQNHRRRAKELGIPVKRTRKAIDGIPAMLDMSLLEDKMPAAYFIPEPLRQVVDSDSEAEEDDGLELGDEEDEFDGVDYGFGDEPEVIDLTDALEPSVPAYAFPTTFQASRTMPGIITPLTPFYFPPPQWRRKAKTVEERTPVSIDELVNAFSLLHTRDATPTASPVFRVPFTCTLPQAPLPSLINRKVTISPVQATTSLNTASARRTSSKGNKGRASKQLAASVPTLATPTPRKQKPSLPKRTPKRAPKQHPSPPPQYQHHPYERQATPPSRTPSLDFSPSSSRNTSFASPASSPPRSVSSGSSGPPTPADTHVPLPVVVAYDPLFGDPILPVHTLDPWVKSADTEWPHWTAGRLVLPTP
ncbi:HD2 homeodomain mating-type protein [Mycena indigotica]|uniref:HD2 homeodomain mating-type protein n=1 Tax=Mycena indigotica TaxID=2126181 RepID=A0A8H6SXR5_9AGAR|nr:HD2 homeodomain mating-type protein [Mycena indigotica]KAF7307080.1 HD2 homeodomain mating-type protein [Mycena indigotica]